MQGTTVPGLQILQGYHTEYQEKIETNDMQNLTGAFKVFSQSGWNNMPVVNSFIQGFGEGFDDYSCD